MADQELNIALAEEKAIARVQSMALRLLGAKKWKQSDLAEAMNVSEAHISQLFAAEPQNLTVKKAARLFYHLGETLDFRCDGIDKLNREAEQRKRQRRLVSEQERRAFEWCVGANGNDGPSVTPVDREPVAA